MVLSIERPALLRALPGSSRIEDSSVSIWIQMVLPVGESYHPLVPRKTMFISELMRGNEFQCAKHVCHLSTLFLLFFHIVADLGAAKIMHICSTVPTEPCHSFNNCLVDIPYG